MSDAALLDSLERASIPTPGLLGNKMWAGIWLVALKGRVKGITPRMRLGIHQCSNHLRHHSQFLKVQL